MFLNWMGIARVFVLIATLFTLSCATIANAQQQAPANSEVGAQPANSDKPRVTNPPPGVSQQAGVKATAEPALSDQKVYLTYKTPYEFWLTGLSIALVLVLGLMLCVMAGLGKLTQEFYKAFLILVVVFSALFLIVAGYSDQQTAPVFSLLGTVAGYIFGRSTSTGSTDAGSTEKQTGADAAPPKKVTTPVAGPEKPAADSHAGADSQAEKVNVPADTVTPPETPGTTDKPGEKPSVG